MTVVDTSVWIDLFAGRDTPQVAAYERMVNSGEDIGICGIVLTEILQGIRDEQAHAETESALAALTWLPMDRATFLFAASIYRRLRARGVTIRNTTDCMIAAACMKHSARLLHKDKDFDRIAEHFALECVDASAEP